MTEYLAVITDTGRKNTDPRTRGRHHRESYQGTMAECLMWVAQKYGTARFTNVEISKILAVLL